MVHGTFAYGKAFENFIINECIRLNEYYSKDYRFSFLRTKNGVEIDLIVDRPGMPVALIEIKSSNKISEKHITNLDKISKDFSNAEAFCLSLDPEQKKIENVLAIHWKQGLKELFS